MADGTIASITKKLGAILLKEYKFLAGVKYEVTSIRDELEWITSFLKDAAQSERSSERLDVWVSQVRDLAHSAEDAIDTFIHTMMYERDRSHLRFFSSRLPFVSNPGSTITVHRVGRKIQDLKAKIERISANRKKYALDKLEKADSLGDDVIFIGKSVPCTSKLIIFGFDSQSNAVKDKLSLANDEDSWLQVVPIAGGPGSGKSTLARKVFDEIKTQFYTCVWIDVPKDFKPEDLLQKMPRKEDSGKLLVVFDDVRETQDWDDIWVHVLCGIGKMYTKGSKVLLTCRSYEVGRHAIHGSRMEPHWMEPLNARDGMELLKLKVDGFNAECRYSVGVPILERCDGIPLAIVLVGGLLSRKRKVPEVWNKVATSLRRLRDQGNSGCSATLALSYDNLPHYLSPCFLYFGLFPQGCLIDCESLIQLWIAEGFIQEIGEKSIEDVAYDYLLELIQRGMIQVCRSNARVETCRIDDTVREHAILKGVHDKFLDIVGNKGLTKPVENHTVAALRVAIHSEKSEILDRKTRSIICFADLYYRKLQKASFYHRNLTYLRVLDLREWKKLNKLPHEIGKFVLLKYLNLRGTQIRKLPSSVRKLLSLQTLDISETRIELTPYWLVWELKELRHFYANLEQVGDPESSDGHKGGFGHRDFLLMVSNNSNARQTKTETRRLENLRTLSTSSKDGWIFNHEFHRLLNLRKLKITEVNTDRHGITVSCSISLFVLLRELEIEWPKGMLKFPSFARHDHLYKMTLSGIIELEGMVQWIFPPNLIEAVLSHVMLDQDGIDALSKLKHLQFLELKEGSFGDHTMAFSENGFLTLLRLDLEGLSKLRELVVKKNSLPKLKTLNLSGLEKLVGLPSELKQGKTLRELNISSMPPEFMARTKKMRELIGKRSNTPTPSRSLVPSPEGICNSMRLKWEGASA